MNARLRRFLPLVSQIWTLLSRPHDTTRPSGAKCAASTPPGCALMLRSAEPSPAFHSFSVPSSLPERSIAESPRHQHARRERVDAQRAREIQRRARISLANFQAHTRGLLRGNRSTIHT